jgi:hypothetical protein
MKRPVARPLLRATALAAPAMACTGVLTAADADDEPEAHRLSRVHLRGEVQGQEGDRTTLTLRSGDGSHAIELDPVGPWPQPVHLTDADLGELVVDTEHVEIEVHRQRGERSFARGVFRVRPRTSRMVLSASRSYQPRTPESAIPSAEAVRAMPPAEPPEEGTHLDLQGVIVLDPRQGVPDVVGLSVRGPKGVAHKRLEPQASSVPFRVQDRDASEGYAFEADKVRLWVKARYGVREDTAVETEIEVPVKASGLVVVPQPIPGPPEAPAAHDTLRVDLAGRVELPELDDGDAITSVRLMLDHPLGWTFEDLPTALPQTFEFSGPTFEAVPVHAGKKTLTLRVHLETRDGKRYIATLDTPGIDREVRLVPAKVEPIEPREAPERPVYGNTKGSRYDDGIRATPPPDGPLVPVPDAP